MESTIWLSTASRRTARRRRAQRSVKWPAIRSSAPAPLIVAKAEKVSEIMPVTSAPDCWAASRYAEIRRLTTLTMSIAASAGRITITVMSRLTRARVTRAVPTMIVMPSGSMAKVSASAAAWTSSRSRPIASPVEPGSPWAVGRRRTAVSRLRRIRIPAAVRRIGSRAPVIPSIPFATATAASSATRVYALTPAWRWPEMSSK